MQKTIEKIRNEVEQLSEDELQIVRNIVNSLLEKKKEAKPKMTEEEFEQHLYEKGIMRQTASTDNGFFTLRKLQAC